MEVGLTASSWGRGSLVHPSDSDCALGGQPASIGLVFGPGAGTGWLRVSPAPPDLFLGLSFSPAQHVPARELPGAMLGATLCALQSDPTGAAGGAFGPWQRAPASGQRLEVQRAAVLGL